MIFFIFVYNYTNIDSKIGKAELFAGGKVWTFTRTFL